MIYKGNREISAIYRGNKAIAEIRRGTQLIWQAVRSCFGKGLWLNDKEWSNTDSWKNNQ
jgi:hypothetical protein